MAESVRKPFIPKGIWLALALTAALMFCVTSIALARPLAQAPDGKTLFTQKGCTACHTIGSGDLVGPDLAGVTGRRTQAWLSAWLTAPDKVLQSLVQ